MVKHGLLVWLAVLLALVLVGCSSESSQTAAPKAVETYLQALVNQNLNQMIAASCGDWEAQAKLENDSFAAVKLSLNNLQCKEVSRDGPVSAVTCTGSIIANYGTEDLEIDVADRTFKVIEDGGEWRMCGYLQQ